MFGKTYAQPRLTRPVCKQQFAVFLLGDKPCIRIQMTPLLSQIQERIHQVCDTQFTTVLLNHYRDGKDSNGWHADNEKELGKKPRYCFGEFWRRTPFFI